MRDRTPNPTLAMRFADRHDAGRQLAARLLPFKSRRPVILALPRGGVPVGFEIARALEAPLDIVLVRKLGSPISPELAIGAIVDGEPLESIINADVVADLDVPASYIEAEIARQSREIERRRARYRQGRAMIDVRDRTAIVVDDGIATGATMRIALRAVRRRRPRRLVMAVPIAPTSTLAAMRGEADDLFCLGATEAFGAVGSFYRDFSQVDDETVIAILAEAARDAATRSAAGQAD
jgi:putative phosphoribosyl transferase